jgi:hypothetical protein
MRNICDWGAVRQKGKGLTDNYSKRLYPAMIWPRSGHARIRAGHWVAKSSRKRLKPLGTDARLRRAWVDRGNQIIVSDPNTADPSVSKSIELDLNLIEFYDQELGKIEWYIQKQAKACDLHSLILLQTVPGIGAILSLVILYDKSAGQPICTATLPEGFRTRKYEMIFIPSNAFQPSRIFHPTAGW